MTINLRFTPGLYVYTPLVSLVACIFLSSKFLWKGLWEIIFSWFLHVLHSWLYMKILGSLFLFLRILNMLLSCLLVQGVAVEVWCHSNLFPLIKHLLFFVWMTNRSFPFSLKSNNFIRACLMLTTSILGWFSQACGVLLQDANSTLSYFRGVGGRRICF